MSAERHQTLKGMQDILPPDISLWQRVEAAAKEIFGAYGFQEIRFPVVEATGVFVRSIGEQTDIVEKEMYTFEDKGGRSVSLRPEGTASVVRAYVQHNLQSLPAPVKFFYGGPMFRYERPQSGRFRQFHQIGVEAFGDGRPRMDAEVVAMLHRFLTRIGLQDVRVQVNSIGCPECRPAYRQALLDFFSGRTDRLCDDCKRRFERNPLRILDCKARSCGELRQGAPKVTDSLCAGCRTHFDRFRMFLSVAGIPYDVNPEMVRGLDYYTRTTFEVTSMHLGAQNAVAAGGRYDRLVAEFGGKPTPAVGFAVGMERIVELLKTAAPDAGTPPDAFVACIGDEAERTAFTLAEGLRREGRWVEIGDAAASLKSQLRKADRLSARYAFIIGEEELTSGRITWKRLADAAQGDAGIDECAGLLSS
ncbi:MAG: histidine--tRNA ligase [Thermodesulfovibrionales bacterium]